MYIRGRLANYLPDMGHRVYVNMDPVTGKVVNKNGMAYMAMVAPSADGSDGHESHIILQVDLKKISSRRGIYGSPNGPDRFSQSQSWDTWIETALVSLGCGFNKVKGTLLQLKRQRHMSKKSMTTEDIQVVSDGAVVAIEEEYGPIPSDLWALIPVYITRLLFGAGLLETVAVVSGVPDEVVKKVLDTIFYLTADSALSAIKNGAASVSYLVPPFGVLEVKRRLANQSGRGKNEEPLVTEFKTLTVIGRLLSRAFLSEDTNLVNIIEMSYATSKSVSKDKNKSRDSGRKYNKIKRSLEKDEGL